MAHKCKKYNIISGIWNPTGQKIEKWECKTCKALKFFASDKENSICPRCNKNLKECLTKDAEPFQLWFVNDFNSPICSICFYELLLKEFQKEFFY